MIHPSSLKTLKYFLSAYPGRTASMVALMCLAGAVEGIGLVALLPVIAIVTGQQGLAPTQIETGVRSLFSFAGVPVTLLTLLGFVILAMAGKAALTMLAMAQAAWTSPRIATDLRLAFLRSILKARWTHFGELSSGASANAIGTEAMRAAYVYRQACNIVAFVILIAVYTVLSLAVSWQMTLAGVLASLLLIAVFHPLVSWARASGEQQTKLYSESLKQLAEVVTGIKPVKAMAREQSYVHMFEGLTDDLEKAQRRQILTEEALRLLPEPLMVIILCAGLYVVMTYIPMDISRLFFLAYLFSRIVARSMNAQRLYQNMVINESALLSLRQAIDEAEKAAETFTGTKAPTLKSALALENVSFSYGRHQVLDNVSIAFRANRLHAVLGPSGSGKTTLIDLVTGLHRPQAGKVTVDGVSLDDTDIRAWRHMIGYVPQEVILFQGSIFYNVTMGDPARTTGDAERALKAAGAWDFVQAMPDGINALVGERGTKLSGGQRQRIAIARAIINNPLLLILDEATSALDASTEEAFLKTVRELARHMTVIAISHKESIRMLADQVFELGGGQISSPPARQKAAVK